MNKPPAPSDLADKFMLRLPDGMRDRIKAAAEENKRSMNAEIIARLEGSFREKPTLHAIQGGEPVISIRDLQKIILGAIRSDDSDKPDDE